MAAAVTYVRSQALFPRWLRIGEVLRLLLRVLRGVSRWLMEPCEEVALQLVAAR